MTLENGAILEEAETDRFSENIGTKYYDEIYGSDIYTLKRIKAGDFYFTDYLEKVEEWKNKNYNSTTDPDFQSPDNIEKLAHAILDGGVLNPATAGKIDFDKIYKEKEYYYSGEEYSYYIFGYLANKYFNFYHVDWGRAFAMQYLNAQSYNPKTYGTITDAPWLIKAFNRGWASANSIEDGYAPSIYEEYSLDEGFLTDGLTAADIVDVGLWIYGAGAAKKITVKVGRDAVISAYINWQIQILCRMLCGESYEEAVSNVDYSSVAWSGLTSAIESDKTVMVLSCLSSALDKFQETNELDFLTLGWVCGLEMLQYQSIKRLIGDPNSIYGKFLYENLKKRNHSKSELLRNICITFNCTSETALEIMRLIPDVAVATILDDLKK